MHEDVGRLDRNARALLGPALISLGFTGLRAHRGNLLGLAAVVGGVLFVENAITRVCPTNHILGIDTKAIEEELFENESATAE